MSSAAAAARRRKVRNALDRCPGYEPNPMFAYLERCKNCGFAKAEHTVIKSEGAALTSYLDPAQAAREKEERRKQLERQQQGGADAAGGFSYLKVDERTRKDAEAKAAAAAAAAAADADASKRAAARPAFKVVRRPQDPAPDEAQAAAEAEGREAAAEAEARAQPRVSGKERPLPAAPEAAPQRRKSSHPKPVPETPSRKSAPLAPEPLEPETPRTPLHAASRPPPRREVQEAQEEEEEEPDEPHMTPRPTPLQRGDTDATLPTTDLDARGSLASLGTAASRPSLVALADRRSARASARMSRFLGARSSRRPGQSLRAQSTSSRTLSRRQNRLTAGKGPRDVPSVRAAHLKQISRLMQVTSRGAAQTGREFRKYEEPSAATLQLLAATGGGVRWRKGMSIDWTQLHALAWNRDEPRLSRALQRAPLRALVDAPSGDTGETALSLACKRGARGCAFALLTAGADASLADRFGLAPAHYAARAGSVELLDMLAQAKADLRADSSELGLSVLHLASRYAGADTVRAVLARKVPVDPEDVRAWTPLFYAVLRPGRGDLVALLADAGADVRRASPEGLTPVHCAALSDDPDQVTALVERGARMDAQDADGWTPAHYCARYNCARALQRLLEYGARPKPRSEAPFTPFEVASHFGCAEVVAALERARGFEPQKIVLDSEELDETEPVLGRYVRMDEELDLAELQTIRDVLQYADKGGGGGGCVVA